MKEFRVIINGLVSDWLNADEWSIEDLMQFLEFDNVNYEYR